MPLPGNINTITVTGTWLNYTGTAQSGTVTFIMNPTVQDSAATTILVPIPVVVTLSAGSISQVLPCTDNTVLSPTGFTYTVTEQIGALVRSYVIALPHTLGSTVDLSALAH